MINNTEIFSIQDLSLEIENRSILKDINFSMSEGEILTIIGPNGGGKTSLAKIIAGIIRPSKGKIIFHKKIDIGYVPQNINIDRTLPLTVKYFIEIFSGLSIEEISEELFFKMNISNRIIHDLSGGELQKVILIATILRKPNLIILDEPIKGLDIEGQADFYKLIEEINLKEKISILMISHDLHKVMRNTQQIICLNTHICCQGISKDLILNPEFTKLFGDKTNIGIYNHHHDHIHSNNNI